MNHKQFVEKFKRELSLYLKAPYYFYKIPDTAGTGGLRPFDAILIYHGAIFALEFKVGKDTLKKHQQYYLQKVADSGGYPLIIHDSHNLHMILEYIKLTAMGRIISKDPHIHRLSPTNFTTQERRGIRLTVQKPKRKGGVKHAKS